MNNYHNSRSQSIKQICLFFSVCLFVASLPACFLYSSPLLTIERFIVILTSPCPLVTDYFAVGNLSAAFLNAALCGFACVILMYAMKTDSFASSLAGYFLVIAHCFYGLNFLNMWPSMLAIFFFCKVTRIHFRDNLDVAMLSTAFGPFFSELLFRYTLGFSFRIYQIHISLYSILLVIILIMFLGLTIPAMLPGAMYLHKGYNLYNGGLAFGLLGLMIYALLYKTMGITAPEPVPITNHHYIDSGESYTLYVNIFFILVFLCCLFLGWYKNGKSFSGYGKLLKNPGHSTSFLQSYGAPLVLINIGVYGFMLLAYFDVIILCTDGAGFTGATTGIILAALAFSASGQHPANVWPILAGYWLLSMLVSWLCTISELPVPWSLSTQSYMNAAAFATGLCPITGHYGKRAGAIAGLISAIICTSTNSMHGGFVLYNGGLTCGITALILVPCLEFYYHKKKEFQHK